MCGHVGIAGDLSYDEEKIVKKMLLFDYFRGMDSTGFACIKRNGAVQIAKVADNPLVLFDTTRFVKALNYPQADVFMGHNRAATRGGVSNGNAHPFHIGHIVGTHNGTLTTRATKAIEDTLGTAFTVDSMAIFAAIAELGIDKTIDLLETGWSSSDGAWSLVWTNTEQGTINFLRNKHRPMWHCFSEDGKRLFWASEWPIIRAAISIGDDNPQELMSNKEGYIFEPMVEDTLYTFDLEELREGKKGKRPKPKVRKLAAKEEQRTYYPAKDDPFGRTVGGTQTGFHVSKAGTQSQGSASGGTKSGTNSTTTSLSDEKVVHLLGDALNPMAGTVTRSRFQEIAKYGCAWCQADVSYNDRGITIIDKDDAVLCADCSGELEQTRVYAKPDLMQVLTNL